MTVLVWQSMKARFRSGDAARGNRAVVRLGWAPLLLASLASCGCGDAEQDAELDRVRADLLETERRLDEASRKVEASAGESQRLARLLEATQQELADARSDAANELRRVGRHVVAVEGELRAMRDSDPGGGRDDHDRADRLSPVGTWARAGAPHRFLFRENGRGQFQTWDPGSGWWRQGKRTVGTMALSSGDFVYEPAGEEGVYVMRYIEQRKRTPPRAEPSAAGPAAAGPSGEARSLAVTDKTRVVELLFIMRSRDDARLVGWSDDPAVGRVAEHWTPEVAGE